MTKGPGFIPYARQDVNENDVRAVIDVLESRWLTQGPSIELFERAVADYCGARYAVAVSSGTAALHIACAAIGMKAGKRLWTSVNTFVASANCARYCGAEVDFVDIDPGTYNLSVVALAAKLVQAEAEGTLPTAVVPVHFAGQPCPMEKIQELARRYGIAVIEDATHALGATRQNVRIGSCAHADMCVLSFHPVKIITSGEGGMVLTNQRELYEKLVRLRSHGITRNSEFMIGTPDGPWYYEQVDLGFNYRITDIQAVLGLNQLQRIDSFIARRREIARRYDVELAGLPLVLPWQDEAGRSSYHLYVVRLRLDRLKRTRLEIYQRLWARKVQVNVHYIPVHLQPYYRSLGFSEGAFPEAERHYREALSIPMYPALTDSEQDVVIDALRQSLADS